MLRRTFVAGSAVALGAAAPRLAEGQSPPPLSLPLAPPLFPTGPLADNSLAKRFRVAPPDLKAAAVAVDASGRKRALNDLRGKVRMVSLWAEWCAPCISEMADLAEANRRRHGDGFEIIAVLTGSNRKLDYEAARALLASKGAELPLWVEPNGGGELLMTLTPLPGTKGGTLPCNLLIDRNGVIRGRAYGSAPAVTPLNVQMENGHLTDTGKAQMAAMQLKTAWTTSLGDAFTKALAEGALKPA